MLPDPSILAQSLFISALSLSSVLQLVKHMKIPLGKHYNSLFGPKHSKQTVNSHTNICNQMGNNEQTRESLTQEKY